MQRIEGSAEGMAHSVQPQVEIDAVVPNQGSSFAPNVIPAALWLGAGIIAFLVHVRVLPNQAETFYRPAQFIGKMIVPTLIVFLQALTVMVVVLLILKINVLHFWAFVASMATASLTFLCIVFAMTRTLGDAGKALAMLFLAVQLSSSGGVLPVELSGGFFASISPWLPMTWVVKALKASMFGAYDDAWQVPLLLLMSAGVGAIIFASIWGRWRFVDPDSVRPGVDF
jgi:putative membrane protein